MVDEGSEEFTTNGEQMLCMADDEHYVTTEDVLEESGDVIDGVGSVIDGVVDVIDGVGDVIDGVGEVIEGDDAVMAGTGDVIILQSEEEIVMDESVGQDVMMMDSEEVLLGK